MRKSSAFGLILLASLSAQAYAQDNVPLRLTFDIHVHVVNAAFPGFKKTQGIAFVPSVPLENLGQVRASGLSTARPVSADSPSTKAA